MRYFVEQDVSGVCFLWEALDWLSLSRLPVSSHDEDGNEIRGSLRAAYKDYQLFSDPLSARELASFGYTGAYDDYLYAILGSVWSESERAARINEIASELTDGENRRLAAFHQASEEEAAVAESLRARIEAGYRHETERAKAEVAGKILSGALPLYGFWCPGEAPIFDPDAEDHELEPRLVPHLDISPSLIDWNESVVSIHDREAGRGRLGAFHLVTLPTAKLIEIFPRRHGEAAQLIVHNGAAFAEGDSQQPPAASTRGRKLKADWLPGAMRSWYVAQREAGKLGGKGMIEADLSAAVQWSEYMGQPVSRSTCQNYLRDLLSGGARKSKP